jgi:hypothetical protein
VSRCIIRSALARRALFELPKKEKPGGGNAGSRFFVIGVYGFKYAAWLLLVVLARARSGLLLLSSQLLFLFFYFLVLL